MRRSSVFPDEPDFQHRSISHAERSEAPGRNRSLIQNTFCHAKELTIKNSKSSLHLKTSWYVKTNWYPD